MCKTPRFKAKNREKKNQNKICKEKKNKNKKTIKKTHTRQSKT